MIMEERISELENAFLMLVGILNSDPECGFTPEVVEVLQTELGLYCEKIKNRDYDRI